MLATTPSGCSNIGGWRRNCMPRKRSILRCVTLTLDMVQNTPLLRRKLTNIRTNIMTQMTVLTSNNIMLKTDPQKNGFYKKRPELIDLKIWMVAPIEDLQPRQTLSAASSISCHWILLWTRLELKRVLKQLLKFQHRKNRSIESLISSSSNNRSSRLEL